MFPAEKKTNLVCGWNPPNISGLQLKAILLIRYYSFRFDDKLL